MARQISEEGLALVKSFEGFRPDAYLCPAKVWTIGWGSTEGVRQGDTITEEEAEKLLRRDLSKFEAGVEALLPGLKDQQFSALVSFAFNVGLSALAGSTLTARIRGGEDPEQVIPEELPKWVKAGDTVLLGLARRRKAEIALAAKDARSPEKAPPSALVTSRPEKAIQKPSEASEVSLMAFFEDFSGSDEQRAGINLLEHAIRSEAPQLLLDDQDWVRAFEEVPAKPASEVRLDVPYLWQLDSELGHGGRMCWSSTNAMLLEYLKPGLLDDHADDTYLQRVWRYGDTTSAEAQVSALKSYGVEAEFRVDGDDEKAKSLLRAGIPVPIGILHHGHVNNLWGGGHWLLLIGFSEEEQVWIANDPYGEIDNVRGGYVSNAATAGRGVKLSYRNLNKRWQVEGPGSGWFIQAGA